jgi:hypothetical protein
MRSFSLSHEIHCDVAAFWRLFFDEAYNVELYARALRFPRYERLELRDGERECFRRVSITPKLEVPAPVAKLLGASFSYEEEGTLDRASGVFRWRAVPGAVGRSNAMADAVRVGGTLRVEPAGEGAVRRVAEFAFEAKIFGVGGLLEASLEKSLRHGWDESARFMNRWLQERALAPGKGEPAGA